MGADDEKKRTIHRSPNYPSFGLSEALDKARIIWDKDGKAGTTRNVALRHIGFKAEGVVSGAAARALSTLKKFGLTEEDGERIKMSQEALDILVLPSTDERHIKALREAALKPKIYNELYTQYAEGFPSDETLRAELIRSHGFNPRQVDGFLRDFRTTIEFSGLLEKAREGEEMPEGQQVIAQPGQPVTGKAGATSLNPVRGFAQLLNSFPIPLRKQNMATIAFNRLPLEKADLELLKKWIVLMEENLTEPHTEQDA